MIITVNRKTYKTNDLVFDVFLFNKKKKKIKKKYFTYYYLFEDENVMSIILNNKYQLYAYAYIMCVLCELSNNNITAEIGILYVTIDHKTSTYYSKYIIITIT